MKKQRKFTSEEQIIKAIEDKKSKVPILLAQADDLEKDGSQFVQNNDVIMREVGRDKLKEAKRARRSAYNIEQKHLPALKRTLAAFRTDTMPFVEDNSVVLQK
jgi:hypothetical protein